MTLLLDAVVFDVADARSAAAFWAGLLGREMLIEPEGAFVPGDYRHVKIDGAGHFLGEEAPEQVNAALVSWLDSLG